MKKTAFSRVLAIVLVLCMMFSLMPAAFAANSEPTCEATVTNIEKYGNLDLSITGKEFFEAGFAYGDIVTVTINGKDYEMPVGGNYSDVDTGSMVCRVPSESANLIVAINMGDMATSLGLATKTTNADKTFVWNYNEGVTTPVKVIISMSQQGGYLSEYLLRQLTRTNDRANYADLNDSQFANFRAITTTGVGAGTLYRSSSPINPEIGRNVYADNAMKGAAVKTVMNLADSQSSAASYAGYSDSYYAKQNIVFLNLGVDFTADSFKAGLADGLRHFANNKGPYIVHCNEGKDRAGFVSAILECLMGASAEEVIADYMVTYYNYYGVQKGTEQYNAIANSNIKKSLANAFEIADITADGVNLAAEAEEYVKAIGLSSDEVAALKANLSEDNGIYVKKDGTDLTKYGHIDVAISTADFLSRFNYGDVVTVTVNGYTFDAPVCSDYTDVKSGATLVRAAAGKSYVILAINYGQISVESGVAHAEGTGYAYNEGLTFPMPVTFELKEAAGYLGQWEAHHLTRTNDRADYANLSDEQFANFRAVSVTGINENTLYRSTSPISDELGRNTYADAASKNAGVKTFINLSDSESVAKAYKGYEGSYYSTQNAVYLDMPVSFTSDGFKSGLAQGYRYMATNEGPYLIHCLEGKDRTGMAIAILECLMGASLDEILDDYMITYYNFYGVTEDMDSYDVVLQDNLVANLQIMLGIDDLYAEDVDLAAEAEAYLKDIGLNADEIAALKANLAGETETKITAPSVKEIDKYGDIRLSITSGEFKALGYDYADYVTVKFLDKELTLPVIPQYRYVEAKGAAIVVWEDDSKPVELEIFNGSFAAANGLATKTTNADKTWFWTANEGVNFPVEIEFSLAEKNGYYDQYVIFDLVRTNDRADYADLTDEQFANFRVVSTTGMGENVLYRSSSPVNTEIGRNTYADAAAQNAGIKTIMNLADSQESAAAYAGYADTYYAKQNVAFLNLGVDFTSETNRVGLADGLRYFIKNEGPYLVHCNEGQDRAGFVSAILECLMGASLDEVVADYMTTYCNYYGVEVGTNQYKAISNNIVKNLKTAFGVDDLTNVDLSAAAVEYIKGLGLSDEEISALKVNLSGKTAPVELPFKDVAENAWYHDAVAYVYENGLMNGVSSDKFAPNSEMTRAMLVTVLYRMAGSPDVSGKTCPFTDVKAGAWYYDAIVWAYENNITNGKTATTFAPNANVTREQTAVILYRYEKLQGADVSGAADLSAYADAAKVDGYAKEAMAWAVSKGIIKGMSSGTATNLEPLGTATRAQVATILMRVAEM